MTMLTATRVWGTATAATTVVQVQAMTRVWLTNGNGSEGTGDDHSKGTGNK
jgi:hypothetical protein